MNLQHYSRPLFDDIVELLADDLPDWPILPCLFALIEERMSELAAAQWQELHRHFQVLMERERLRWLERIRPSMS